jgi:hypothetical protein
MTARQAVRLATLTLTAAPPRRRVERLLLLDTRAGRIDRLAAPGRSVIGPIAPVVASVEHSVIAPIALDREAADPPPPAAGTAPPQRIAPVQNVARSGIVRVVRTVVSVGRSVTAASVRRRVIVRSVLRLVGVLRSVTGRIVRVVRTVVSVGRSVTAASVPLETTVASVGSTTAVLSVQPRATVRSGRRPVSVVRSVIARIDLLPAIGRPAPTVVPRATVRIAPGVRRQTTAGPRRVTVGRRVTVRSVLRVATVPIAAPEQPDALRATAASVRTRRAAASGPRRGSVSARSALHRTVGHGTSVRRARSARRAKTSGQVGRRSQTASPPPRSPRMCCSRIWTVRYGRGCAR